MSTGAPFPSVEVAQERVLHFQRKLHEWASADAERRFHDLRNLVCDPATLVVAWSRVSRNRGSRTAGVDADTRRHIEARGVEQLLTEIREELRSGTFRPLPVRERLIPKRDGRMRRLGITECETSGTEVPVLTEPAQRRERAGVAEVGDQGLECHRLRARGPVHLARMRDQRGDVRARVTRLFGPPRRATPFPPGRARGRSRARTLGPFSVRDRDLGPFATVSLPLPTTDSIALYALAVLVRRCPKMSAGRRLWDRMACGRKRRIKPSFTSAAGDADRRRR